MALLLPGQFTMSLLNFIRHHLLLNHNILQCLLVGNMAVDFKKYPIGWRLHSFLFRNLVCRCSGLCLTKPQHNEQFQIYYLCGAGTKYPPDLDSESRSQ